MLGQLGVLDVDVVQVVFLLGRVEQVLVLLEVSDELVTFGDYVRELGLLEVCLLQAEYLKLLHD